MQAVWPIFVGGLAWGVRDGRTINFWRECLIDSGIVLGELVSPTPGCENMVVADFCTPVGAWDIAKLSRVLPKDALEAVIGMTPACNDAEADLPIWEFEANEARNLRQSITNQKRVTDVRWRAAEQQFTTLNTDGSVCSRGGGATAGGCICNEEGRVLDAYACNLGRCSITRAELTRAIIGLERAWELGGRKVEVQMDSSCAISILDGKLNLEHQHTGLVLRFKQLAERSWTIQLTHIYREGNHLADHLANKGHDLDYGTHSIRQDEASVLYWARYDAMGCAEQRLISAM
ncbi:Putative ribonuclease H protein At1g65750 [Linum perenne]